MSVKAKMSPEELALINFFQCLFLALSNPDHRFFWGRLSFAQTWLSCLIWPANRENRTNE